MLDVVALVRFYSIGREKNILDNKNNDPTITCFRHSDSGESRAEKERCAEQENGAENRGTTRTTRERRAEQGNSAEKRGTVRRTGERSGEQENGA